MQYRAVDHLPVAALKPYDRNARTHSPKQIRQLAASIEEFGFTNPVLIDSNRRIVAGHGRVDAAKLLGLDTVPVICLDDLNEAQIRAYVIADNKLAENAGWDRELLGLELQYLTELEIDFDATITGFEVAEIDILVGELEVVADEDPADEVPEVDESEPPVTWLGDLWPIGRHRLLCGDATDPDAYGRLLVGEQAQMVFTDPPYNVPIDGHVCGLGKVKHREFAMAAGEMSKAEFTAFLSTVFSNLADASVGGAIHFVCIDWRHIGEIVAAGTEAYTEFKNPVSGPRPTVGWVRYTGRSTSWCLSSSRARRRTSITSSSASTVATEQTSGRMPVSTAFERVVTKSLLYTRR